MTVTVLREKLAKLEKLLNDASKANILQRAKMAEEAVQCTFDLLRDIVAHIEGGKGG